jgi:hypothetical protein
METSGLKWLARFDEHGRAHFRVVENLRGEFVLDAQDRPVAKGHRPLAGVDCMRLALLAPERPSLVVESADGDYVVLVESPPDLERHSPLDFDDSELLTNVDECFGHYGRRDDDVLRLTPWAPEDEIVPFNPDGERFSDVPVVEAGDEGMSIIRGELDERLHRAVLAWLDTAAREPGARYGVFANPFGEFTCVMVGAPLEPHEDLRYQAMVRGRSAMDGAKSLSEAAEALRALADQLDAAEADGWQLPHPITNDHGFPERIRE